MDVIVIVIVVSIVIIIIVSARRDRGTAAQQGGAMVSQRPQSAPQHVYDPQVVNDASKEFFDRLPQVVGEAMAGDLDDGAEALSFHVLITGPAGYLSKFKDGKSDWVGALDIVDTGIDEAMKHHGPYRVWDARTKKRLGYILAYFYLSQAMCRAEISQFKQALNESIPHANEVEEATPALRAAIQELKLLLQTLV